jgi:molybdopterin molybdotransferase
MLGALLREHGCVVTDSVRVPDDRDRIAAVLLHLCSVCDLVITTGGASAGEADHLPGLLSELGERVFWKVAIKPGMPVLFGAIGGCPVFGLPGNAVSVFATFLVLVRPALALLQRCPALDPAPVTARLAEGLRKQQARSEFRRARISVDAEGVLRAQVHPSTSSGALHSVAESDALVALAAGAREYPAGCTVPVYRLRMEPGPP